MIQDIGKGRYHNEYKPVPPTADSYVISCRAKEIFLKKQDNQIQFLTYGEVTEKLPDIAEDYTYLFRIDDKTYYLLPPLSEEDFPDASWNNLTVARNTVPAEAGFAAITAYQLFNWYRTRKFCPTCGKPMVHDAKERMMRCESCGHMEFPKICPAVIVAVTKGDQLLLTKYAGRGYAHYALIAGFTEIGETIEETVHREVMEEAGVKVKNLRYYKCQPWSFSDTLLFGFFCDVDGEDTIHMDAEELAVAEWVNREDVPEDDGVSLTREMMRVFREGRELEPVERN